jgi:hypothetical protein
MSEPPPNIQHEGTEPPSFTPAPAARLFCGLSGFLASGAGVRVAVTAVAGCGPVRGWSGRCGGRAVGRGEQVLPFVLAVPAFGQVEGEVAAAVPGGGSIPSRPTPQVTIYCWSTKRRTRWTSAVRQVPSLNSRCAARCRSGRSHRSGACARSQPLQAGKLQVTRPQAFQARSCHKPGSTIPTLRTDRRADTTPSRRGRVVSCAARLVLQRHFVIM